VKPGEAGGAIVGVVSEPARACEVYPAPAPALGYRPALDGLRALAIAAVVLAHLYGWPLHGGNGVELFFVLSGFLITSLLLEEHETRGRVSLRSFYARRAYRLLPALYVMLGVFVAWFGVTGRLNRHAWVGVAAGLTYVTNFLGSGFAGIPFELQVLWTLAQEEQFYVLWPPLLFFVLRGRRRLGLAVALAGAVLAVVQDLEAAHGSWSWSGATPAIQSFGILLGCAAAISVRLGPTIVARARALTLPSLVIVIGMLIYLPSASFYPWPFVLFCAACAVLVVSSYEGSSRTARLVLSNPAVVYLGKISYSLYLWNVLVLFAISRYVTLDASSRLFSLVACLVVAGASYSFVEMPFLRRKRRLSRSASAAMVVAEQPSS
jgi:peptidoglycan/LPS O-acetylase OafA/YrhL